VDRDRNTTTWLNNTEYWCAYSNLCYLYYAWPCQCIRTGKQLFNLFQIAGTGYQSGQSNPQELCRRRSIQDIGDVLMPIHWLQIDTGKRYYLYRDKIVLSRNKMALSLKSNLAQAKWRGPDFWSDRSLLQSIQVIISLKRENPSSEQPLTLAATYQGCNEPVGCVMRPLTKLLIDVTCNEAALVQWLKRLVDKRLQRRWYNSWTVSDAIQNSCYRNRSV